MKGLIQRVTRAQVEVDGCTVGKIDHGILLLLGVEKHDTESHAEQLLGKVLSYRVFNDQAGKMNRSVTDVNGGLLVVPQFTLAADTRKGLRPSFSSAAAPESAERLYDYFVGSLKKQYAAVAFGVFAADMQVMLVNDGPVTFLLET